MSSIEIINNQKNINYIKHFKKLRRKIKKKYNSINKDGEYSGYFRKRVITFLLCYNRFVCSKKNRLDTYLLKRLCYPILKLGYYVEHSMNQYINKDKCNIYYNKNNDFIINPEYKHIHYLISYKLYFVNKRMLEYYNTDILSEYINYIKYYQNKYDKSNMKSYKLLK